MNDVEPKNMKILKWTQEHENILIDWADKAMCFRWLHAKSNQIYARLNAWFTIPVIIMSTLTGTANFAQDRFPESAKNYASMAIGTVNIFAGILTTIQQFLKIGELNEAHRVASISWDKFYRNIKVELAKSPDERIQVDQLIKMCKEEFDRLMETSPVIEDKVISLFQNTFSTKEVDQEKWSDAQKMFKELKKPEICDVLESTKNSVYKAPPKVVKSTQATNNKHKNTFLNQKNKNRLFKEKTVYNFIENFKNEYSRDPTQEEILEDMEGQISKKIIENVLINKDSLKNIDIDNNLINNVDNHLIKSKNDNSIDDAIDIVVDEDYDDNESDNHEDDNDNNNPSI